MDIRIYSPVSGKIIKIEDVTDPAFSQKLVGDGIAVRPALTKQFVTAPCDGVITTVSKTSHAFAILANEMEVLVHIGVDTVNLKGAGFHALVKAEEKVTKGQNIIEVDFSSIAPKVPSCDVIIVITNLAENMLLKTEKLEATAGEMIFVATNNAKLSFPTEMTAQEAEVQEMVSEIITVYNEAGLHARPAANLNQMANKFKSAIQIKKGERTVNAKSTIAIMGLGVKYLEQIQFIAKGEDAKDAVKTLTQGIADGLGETPKMPSASTVALAPAANTSNAALAASIVKKQEIKDFSKETELTGVSAAPGFVIGKSFTFKEEQLDIIETASNSAKELEMFEKSLKTVNEILLKDIDLAKKSGHKTKIEIFEAHQSILSDADLKNATIESINGGKSAAAGWRSAISDAINTLKATNDALLIERTADFKDIGRRVTLALLGKKDVSLNFTEPTILLAEDLVPSDVMKFEGALIGVILAGGSATSHVSLILRNMGVPAVVAVGKSVMNIGDGASIVMDGEDATIIVNPDNSKLENIKKKINETDRIRRENIANGMKPAITKDGRRIIVKSNISNSKQAADANALGGEGIGLFRTEFLFFESPAAPTEEEQRIMYQEVLDAVDGPVTLRTLDVGGDKPLSYVYIEPEENPIMGMRGVRTYAANPDVFLTQVRAILRTKPLSRVKIMIPMIADVDEIKWVKEVIEEEKNKMGIKEELTIGAMIEIPSAALLAEHLGKHTDFLSIGTNDLAQYTLAMDRGNKDLTGRLNNLHPAILKLIKCTVEGGDINKISTAVCGAMASQPRAIPILVGLGICELSTSLKSIPDIKAQIRELSYEKCRVVAEKAMTMASAEEVSELLKKELGI